MEISRSIFINQVELRNIVDVQKLVNYQSHYGEDQTKAFQAQEKRSTDLVQDGLTGLF